MASSKTATLAKYGLTAALGAAATLTITTFTATTANITTVNATTVTASTVSGSSLAIGNAGDQKHKIACYGTGGVLGVCSTNTADNCGCKVN